MKIAPSILSCDFSKMGNEVQKISNAKADFIHLDVMDGIFVPNLTFGPCIINAVRKYSKLPFDVHLMIKNPYKYIENFFKAGANIITFHIEAEDQIEKTLNKILSYNLKAGIAVKPSTNIKKVFPFLNKLYMVVVMTVEPGFGGQCFMEDMMDKVDTLKNEIKTKNLNTLIEVDGGINLKTASIAKNHGVDICVAGTSIFKAKNMENAIYMLKNI